MISIKPTKIQQEMNVIRDVENFLLHGGVITVCKPKMPRKYRVVTMNCANNKIVRV